MADKVILDFFLIVAFAQPGLLLVLGKAVIPEPVCTSRYGFESSLLKDMLELNFNMKILKQSYSSDFDNLKTQTEQAVEKLASTSQELEQTQSNKVDELTSLGEDLKAATKAMKTDLDAKGDDLKAATEAMKTDLDAKGDDLKAATEAMKTDLDVAKEALKTDIEDKFTAYQQTVEKKLEELTAAALKRPVAFLVNTVTDTTYGGAGTKVLKFTKSAWNTNDDYDMSSGYFTAPYNGTYMFNLQLCIYYQKAVHVELVVDGTVFNSAYLYDATGGYPCYTVSSGVAVLTRGSRVCARLGTGSSTATVLHQDNTRWNSFMGVLVH